MIGLLILALVASTALADREARIQRLDDVQIQNLVNTPRQCLVGNLNAPSNTIGLWFTAQEEYSYLFTAPDCCETGFNIQAVHMVLHFDENWLYPFEEFDVYAYLEEAIWDDSHQCWVPGVEDCASEVTYFTIDAPGLWDLAVPIADCDCAYVYDPTGAPNKYMVSLYFPLPFDANIVTDDIPVGCTSWNNWGYGWSDLVTDNGFPGELIMYAEVDCCDSPIEAEEQSWGEIKELYR